MTVEIQIAQSTDAKEWDRIVSESTRHSVSSVELLKINEKYTWPTLYPLSVYKWRIIGVFLFLQKKGRQDGLFRPMQLVYLGLVFSI
jgi:hypothetical protein